MASQNAGLLELVRLLTSTCAGIAQPVSQGVDFGLRERSFCLYSSPCFSALSTRASSSDGAYGFRQEIDRFRLVEALDPEQQVFGAGKKE